ncbi:MAG: DMT family transporter [Caldilineaceae bacterium]|nr:DMT family transporter [Caldilineaceae bacterium]
MTVEVPTVNGADLSASTPRMRAYAMLAFGILCISFSAIFISWAHAPGAVTGFYRMGIATVILAVPFARRLHARGALPRREVSVALLAGAFFAGDLVFWNTGILLSGAANPTLMANTSPIWVALGALLIFHEKLTPMFWGGLCLTLLGALTIFGADLSGDAGLGTFFGLLAGIFYAGYLLVTQRSRRKLDALTFFWLAALSSTILLLLAALLLRQPLTGYSPLTWLNFLALGILTQVMGQLAISFALGALPASLVSPTLLGQPVLTMVWAVLLLGETPTIWHLLGGVVLLIGILVVHRSRL